MWVPPEVKKPVLLHHPTRKSVGYFGAIRLRDGKFVYQREDDVFHCEYLPPYSPDLNPIERVWKFTRRLCVHNRYFPELSDLTNLVEDQFHVWIMGNNDLRNLCAI